MWPLLTLAHCSHECLMPRRRSKYSGADIIPSTTKGLGALETSMFSCTAAAATPLGQGGANSPPKHVGKPGRAKRGLSSN